MEVRGKTLLFKKIIIMEVCISNFPSLRLKWGHVASYFSAQSCKVLSLLSTALLFLSSSLICTDEQGALYLENKQIHISKVSKRVKNTKHRDVCYVISATYIKKQLYFITLLEERVPKQRQCMAKESQLFNAESTHIFACTQSNYLG